MNDLFTKIKSQPMSVLRRSGSKFVERTDIQGSTRDARQIVKAALGGESLGFFPEGTFRTQERHDKAIERMRGSRSDLADKADGHTIGTY